MKIKLWFSLLVLLAILCQTQPVKAEEFSDIEVVKNEQVTEERFSMDSESLMPMRESEENLLNEQLEQIAGFEESMQPVESELKEHNVQMLSLLEPSERKVNSDKTESDKLKDLSEEDEIRDSVGQIGFRSPGDRARYHTVKVGDSLWAISHRYGLTVDELMKLNDFTSMNTMIHPGDLLKVSLAKANEIKEDNKPIKKDTPVEAKTIASVNETYTVQSGDSLWKISQKYRLTLNELVELNGFSSYNVMLYPGQNLVVGKVKSEVVNTKPVENNLIPPSNKEVEATQYYIIESGDSFWKIANQYGLTVEELLRLNGFNLVSTMIHPGQN